MTPPAGGTPRAGGALLGVGDGMPGGEWVADVSERVNGPHPGRETDFCAMVTELIG